MFLSKRSISQRRRTGCSSPEKRRENATNIIRSAVYFDNTEDRDIRGTRCYFVTEAGKERGTGVSFAVFGSPPAAEKEKNTEFAA